ncbi:hypothetical protein D3C76_1406400 [compost metagenome]
MRGRTNVIDSGAECVTDAFYVLLDDKHADALPCDQATAQAQRRDSFANHWPADVEFLAQGLFGRQFLARTIRAYINAIGQFTDNRLCKIFPARTSCRVHFCCS